MSDRRFALVTLRFVVIIVAVALAPVGCGGDGRSAAGTGSPTNRPTAQSTSPSTPTPSEERVGSSDDAETGSSGDAAWLETPFTAEQIRDAWVEGLTLVFSKSEPSGSHLERWRVVSADADGATIEFTPLDTERKPTSERSAVRSTWAELRDHARFPADLATRERVTRDTPLGHHDGWLYTYDDPASRTETEFFFADALPGAPVELVTTDSDGATVLRMEQIERETP